MRTNKEEMKNCKEENKNCKEQKHENIMPDSELCKDCIPQETIIENVKLAHAYVPFQKYCETYMPLEALKRGTAFPELSLPNFDTFFKMKH